MRSIHQVFVIVLFFTALVVVGCGGHVTTKSFRLLGAPEPPPTDPGRVQILTTPPLGPFVRLGRVDAVPEGEVGNEKIEEALRSEAAKMGADAVIVGFQGQLPMGFSIQGFPGAAEARREVGRVVVGTAIKFGME